MAKEMTGPYGQQITELNAELARYERRLQDAKIELRLAIESRDLAKVIELRAVRDAIPDIVAAITKERDALNRLRLAEINRQAIQAHEAAFAELPKHETIINPNDPNSRTVIVRATM